MSTRANNATTDGTNMGRPSTTPSNNKSNNKKKAGNEDEVEDSVTGLNLSGARLLNLSKTIGIYTNISQLNLANNQLSKLPAAIGRLVNLRQLDLSNNHLIALPVEIGRLNKLTELDLRSNNLSTLPPEMGRLVRLEKLRLDNNAITSPPYEIVTSNDVRSIIFWLRDHIKGSGSRPPRSLVQKADSRVDTSTPDQSVKVMCYNVLSPSYATSSQFPHCPSWALDWGYRSNAILHELLAFDADIVCLQEVTVEHFETLFTPELEKAGYEGIHQPKARFHTMAEDDRRTVDGCCIYWKHSRFSLRFEKLVDFVEQAMARSDDLLENHDAFNRLISKDNNGLIAVLEMKGGGHSASHEAHFPALNDSLATRSSPRRSSPSNSPSSTPHLNPNASYLLVCNTHVHWNPEFNDVKLIQAQLLVEEVEKLIPENIKVPVILCGDFNSTPDSSVWQLLNSGHVAPTHEDFCGLSWGKYRDLNGKGEGCKHNLNLSSAYKTVLNHEPDFTNCGLEFCGCLSYIWYQPQFMRAQGVLDTISRDMLAEHIAMPNTQFPSDHISLLADFVLLEDDVANSNNNQQTPQTNSKR